MSTQRTLHRLHNFTAALESGDVSGLRASKLVYNDTCECGSVASRPFGNPVKMRCIDCGLDRPAFRRVTNWELGIQTEGGER